MTRTGKYKRLANVGAIFIVAGSLLLTQMSVNTTYGTVTLNMVVLGLGIGSLMPLMNVAVQNAFPYNMMGTVNSTSQFVSSLGGVVAAPIFGSVLNQVFTHQLTTALPASLTQLKDITFEPQSTNSHYTRRTSGHGKTIRAFWYCGGQHVSRLVARCSDFFNIRCRKTV